MFLASSAFSDLRYAIRQLRRSPGFAAAAVLTLARSGSPRGERRAYDRSSH